MLSFLATAALATAVPAANEPTPPHNVVLILIDDVGCDLVGAYESYYTSLGRPAGSPASTPAIDQLLAARGVLFTNAWTAPMCTPSRAQLLTGRQGFRTGVGSVLKDTPSPQRNPGLGEDERLLPEVLHLAPRPYTCVGVGKWHLADLEQLSVNPTHPLGVPAGRWFDRYAGSMFNLNPAVPAAGQNVYLNWLKTYASFIDPAVNPCAGGLPPCEVGMTAPPLARYATVDTTDDALLMLQTLPEPWFLYVSYNAAHVPGHAVPLGLPQSSCGNYAPDPLPCDPGQPSTVASRVRCVLAELDNQLGRLLCAVDEGDTTVILMGDNGTDSDVLLAPFDPAHGKGSLYEEGVHVPLIIRSPLQLSTAAGSVSTALVSVTDVFATVAKIAGVPASVPMPEDSLPLTPYLFGLQGSRRKTNYTESFLPNFRGDPSTGAPPGPYVCFRHNQAIRDERYKLIRRTERNHTQTNLITVTEEFYDLLQGGPLSAGFPPLPTPDWFETNDLLVSGITPHTRTARALAFLRSQLDSSYPALVR